MSDDTMKFMPMLALRNYTIVAAMLSFVGIFCWYEGASLELTLLRMAVMPLLFLATRGVVSLYRHPIIEHKVTLRAVEFVFLQAVVPSLAAFILLWNQDSAAGEMISLFFSIFFALLFANSIFMLIDVKKNKEERNQGSN